MKLLYSMADQDFRETKSIGIYNLSRGLLLGLLQRPEVDEIVLLANRGLVLPQPPDNCLSVHYFDGAIKGRIRRIFWDQWHVYTVASRIKADWMVLPKGFASMLRKPPIPLLTYVHDTMPFFYRRQYPNVLPAGESAYFARSILASLKHSSLVFTNSEFSRSELMRLGSQYRIRLPPIQAVGIGFSSGIRIGIKKDQILVLIGRWPHKRTDLAVEYLARWQRSSAFPGEIHFVGPAPPELKWPSFENWRQHARLPENSYRELLLDAKALVYFSEYEGFGMPPVEAVLARTAPVYSNIPACLEVMSDVGFPFQNNVFHSFATALQGALQCPSAVLEQWALRLIQIHSWSAVLHKVVGSLMIEGKGSGFVKTSPSHEPP